MIEKEEDFININRKYEANNTKKNIHNEQKQFRKTQLAPTIKKLQLIGIANIPFDTQLAQAISI